MWAEWMSNYDLTITKEDIEKWEKMKREQNIYGSTRKF